MPGRGAPLPGAGSIFLRRGHDGDDPYLVWKVRILAAGAALGVVGIALDRRVVVWAAIAVLGVGFVLAFLGRMNRDGE